jgi:transposase
MAKRNFTLNEEQRAELRRCSDSSQDARTVQRLQAVRLYGEGRSAVDIQDLVGCGVRTLFEWCERYRDQGVAGLASGWTGGHNAKLSAEQRAAVIDKLQQYRPDQILKTDERRTSLPFWTVSDARLAVQRWYGVSWQSDTSYRTLLAQAGLSLQRTEPRYRSRPNDVTVAEFEAELEKKRRTSSNSTLS